MLQQRGLKVFRHDRWTEPKSQVVGEGFDAKLAPPGQMRNQLFAKERSILKTKRAAHRDKDTLTALEARARRSLGPREDLLEDQKDGECPDCRPDVVGTSPTHSRGNPEGLRTGPG